MFHKRYILYQRKEIKGTEKSHQNKKRIAMKLELKKSNGHNKVSKLPKD